MINVCYNILHNVTIYTNNLQQIYYKINIFSHAGTTTWTYINIRVENRDVPDLLTEKNSVNRFLADRTNGPAIATLLCLSSSVCRLSSVCDVMYCG